MSIPLPKKYFSWLKTVKNYIEYSDREFSISSSAVLEEEVNIDDMKTQHWQKLSSYINTYQEMTGENETYDDKGNTIPLERLRACVTIGDDDNGDPLFVDPSDDYSVWCYYHDGGDVEMISSSLDDFMAESKILDD